MSTPTADVHASLHRCNRAPELHHRHPGILPVVSVLADFDALDEPGRAMEAARAVGSRDAEFVGGLGVTDQNVGQQEWPPDLVGERLTLGRRKLGAQVGDHRVVAGQHTAAPFHVRRLPIADKAHADGTVLLTDLDDSRIEPQTDRRLRPIEF
jgi:hypothetical protein